MRCFGIHKKNRQIEIEEWVHHIVKTQVLTQYQAGESFCMLFKDDFAYHSKTFLNTLFETVLFEHQIEWENLFVFPKEKRVHIFFQKE